MSRLSKERGGNWNWRELSECWYCSDIALIVVNWEIAPDCWMCPALTANVAQGNNQSWAYIPWDHWSNCIPTNPEILPSGYSNEDDCKVLLTRRDPHATKCVASVSACNKKRPIGNQVCCLCERLEYSLTMDNVTSLFNKVVRMQESQLSDVLWTLRDAVILASVSSLNTL